MGAPGPGDAGDAGAPGAAGGAPRGGPWQTGAVAAATGLRLAAAPAVMALCLAADFLPALAVFALAAATDYLDGYLARRWRVTTTTGSFLDTTADKLLVTAALVALVAVGRASPWAAAAIVGREVMILGLRAAAAANGVVVVASQLGRVKATLQFLAVAAALYALGPQLGPLPLYQWLMWLAVALTLISAADYLGRFAGVAAGRPGRAR